MVMTCNCVPVGPLEEVTYHGGWEPAANDNDLGGIERTVCHFFSQHDLACRQTDAIRLTEKLSCRQS